MSARGRAFRRPLHRPASSISRRGCCRPRQAPGSPRSAGHLGKHRGRSGVTTTRRRHRGFAPQGRAGEGRKACASAFANFAAAARPMPFDASVISTDAMTTSKRDRRRRRGAAASPAHPPRPARQPVLAARRASPDDRPFIPGASTAVRSSAARGDGDGGPNITSRTASSAQRSPTSVRSLGLASKPSMPTLDLVGLICKPSRVRFRHEDLHR